MWNGVNFHCQKRYCFVNWLIIRRLQYKRLFGEWTIDHRNKNLNTKKLLYIWISFAFTLHRFLNFFVSLSVVVVVFVVILRLPLIWSWIFRLRLTHNFFFFLTLLCFPSCCILYCGKNIGDLIVYSKPDAKCSTQQ